MIACYKHPELAKTSAVWFDLDINMPCAAAEDAMPARFSGRHDGHRFATTLSRAATASVGLGTC